MLLVILVLTGILASTKRVPTITNIACVVKIGALGLGKINRRADSFARQCHLYQFGKKKKKNPHFCDNPSDTNGYYNENTQEISERACLCKMSKNFRASFEKKGAERREDIRAGRLA